ncbi:unnamed protein product [Amoebophrya sp. A120]|nr:unnamed protein product [Amoebophrya sp. A120]|eukprot:GSA120T00010110001.1
MAKSGRAGTTPSRTGFDTLHRRLKILPKNCVDHVLNVLE